MTLHTEKIVTSRGQLVSRDILILGGMTNESEYFVNKIIHRHSLIRQSQTMLVFSE